MINQQVMSFYFLRNKDFPRNAEVLLSYIEKHIILDNYHDVMRSFDHDFWLKNREKEFIIFINNETWTLVSHFLDIMMIDSHWIYIIKNENSSRYKSRFCVKDFSQYYDINYEKTYASIIKLEFYIFYLRLSFIIIIKFMK